MRKLIAALTLLLAFPAWAPAWAQSPKPIAVETGAGHLVYLLGPATSVFAADPKVVEVRPASPTSMFLFGVAPGRTTVAATDNAGHTVGQFDVTVRPSSFGSSEASNTIGRLLPGSSVQATPRANGISLHGQVKTPAEAEQAVSIAKSYAPDPQLVDNRLSVKNAIQVNLRVRVAEMSRYVTRNLGVNWQALGTIGSIGSFPAVNLVANAASSIPCIVGSPALGAAGIVGSKAFTVGPNLSKVCQGGNVNGLIDALAQDQLVHLLAEPNLTAISGETASFLVGGEFPIPVGQENGTVTIEFKQYGISLAFVPTVLGSDRISLHVRPEVSQLTNQGSVQLQVGNSTLVIPALTVRRAETTVEVGSGQSFAIAGLMTDNTSVSGTGLPVAGDVPVLGSLFRSDAFQKNETELVIVVTPYVVRPVSEAAAVSLPTDGWRAPSDLERILLLRQKARGSTAATAATIPGDAGFIVQ